MLKREDLLDAMSGVREEDILAAARAMGYLPAVHRRSLLRPLLIAAALAALLTATAVAAGLLGRAQRMAPMPPDPSGEARQAEIVNGFRGSPTYRGSAQWWEFMARWKDQHGPEPDNYRLDFVHGDLDTYLVCTLYGAYAREQAETLYAIAEEYGLKLYREQVYFGGDMEEFYSLTGVKPFLSAEIYKGPGSGYVLEDGSFGMWSSLTLGRKSISFELRRYYTGSIVPFGGAGRLKDYSETEYVTARQEKVFIDLFGPGDMEITYMDPAGETYISLQPFVGYGEDALAVCREIADQVSFQALCSSDTRLVQEILDQPTGAEENPEAVAAIRRFQESPVFRAGKEFQAFYEENFYGVSFSGTYGLEGYPDIDEKLETLGKTYGLTYARSGTRGLEGFRKATVFDNGAFHIPLGWGYAGIHYIPKDALYTMNSNFLDVDAFRRIWPYVTEEGTELIICTQGPGSKGGGYIFLETGDAYILMGLNSSSPRSLEQTAEEADWDLILKTGGEIS